MMDKFHFRPVLTICTFVSLAILIGLGTWQMQRLNWKKDIIAKVEARISSEPQSLDTVLARFNAGDDADYFPVTITGTFDVTREAHVFGTLEGEPGYFLFTPMRLENGSWVYINRGFVPETKMGSLPEPLGYQTVTGLFRAYQPLPVFARWLNPQADIVKNQWYERNPLAFAATADITAPSAWIDAYTSPDAYPRNAQTYINISNRHFEYALTWFGLALTLIVVFAGFSYTGAKSRD